MASQVEANRRNALISTGPQTEAGKKRSRGNAVRHGLTAETVIVGLEDAEDYAAFELSVTADFDAQTAVERELVLRLASLLWRLRRTTAIETGLLQIQSEILREIRQARGTQTQVHDCDHRVDYDPITQHKEQDDLARSTGSPQNTNMEIGRCFLRLANLDNGAFDRLTRYESALWRQVGQILLTLDSLRRSR
jgi:hypothetical protein